MSERQSGWYWVRLEDNHPWEVAKLSDSQMEGIEDMWAVVGPRIPTPDEPWKTAPVDPTREMVLDGAWQSTSGVDDVMEACAQDTGKAMLNAATKPEDT